MSGSVAIYSIGHSDHTLGELVDLLRRHGVTAVADVRSQPYSRWAPQSNRESLQRALEEAGMDYCYLGAELGGRPADRSLYAPGQEQPDYARLASTAYFRAGLERLLELARQGVVAMMCSEGDPEKCHRSLLITPELLAGGVQVIHILPDGQAVAAQLQPRQLSLF